MFNFFKENPVKQKRFTKPVVSIERDNKIWESNFREKSNIFKIRNKNQIITFSRAITFAFKKIRRSQLFRGALHNPLNQLSSNFPIWESSFQKNQKTVKKFDFSQGHSFLYEKNGPAAQAEELSTKNYIH